MKTTLNPVAKKWVKALRSGKYRRTTQRLQKDGKYCCLGVLCELAVKDGVIDSYNPDAGSLPTVVQDWAGLNSDDGTYQTSSLVRLNDGYKPGEGHSKKREKPFSYIANIIEKKPAGLFVNGK